jgi:hypothetical protein
MSDGILLQHAGNERLFHLPPGWDGRPGRLPVHVIPVSNGLATFQLFRIQASPFAAGARAELAVVGGALTVTQEDAVWKPAQPASHAVAGWPLHRDIVVGLLVMVALVAGGLVFGRTRSVPLPLVYDYGYKAGGDRLQWERQPRPGTAPAFLVIPNGASPQLLQVLPFDARPR